MMFGWSKKEKNEKKLNQERDSLAKLSAKDRGQKLSRLRRRYPRYSLGSGMFDFADDLFDMDLIILYLLLSDDMAVEEADVFDNPESELAFEVGQDLVDRVEAAVVSDAVVEAEEVVSEATPETVSFDSTPVESLPPVESTPETTSFSDSDSGSSYSGGGGYDSGSSYDSGGDSGGD